MGHYTSREVIEPNVLVVYRRQGAKPRQGPRRPPIQIARIEKNPHHRRAHLQRRPLSSFLQNKRL
jgi:hypothetical protein